MGKRREDEEHMILLRVNAQAEDRVQAETGGPSIHEEMWRVMDRLMDNLMSGKAHEDRMEQDRFRALGVGDCLLIIGKPLVSDMDDVRAEAMRRWEARQKKQPAKRKRRSS